MGERITTPVQTLDRTFSIIELLSDYPKGMALMEICNSTGLPKGTVSRMLGSLIEHKYAIQDAGNKKYLLTMRFFEMGSKVVGGVNILSVARPYLDDLSNETKEAIHLVSRVKDEVVYLYKEEASNSVVRMSSCVGMHNPMYCTGVGKAIMAGLPDKEIREIWDRSTIISYTEKTITDFDRLMTELKEIRTNGYAIDDEEHEPGVKCLAAPILDYSGHPIAAISISAPVERMTQETIKQYVPMITDAAQKITGYI